MRSFLDIVGAAFDAVVPAGGSGRSFRTRDEQILDLTRVTASPIAELQAGSVAKICGSVDRLRATLQAPLTGRTCVWYRLTIWRRVVRDWVAVADQQDGVDFLVKDESGRAHVAVRRAEAVLARDFTGNTKYEVPDGLVAFLRSHGTPVDPSMLGHRLGKTFRYTERALEVGAPVAVVGSVRFEPTIRGVVSGYRHRAKRAVLEAAGGGSVLFSNLPCTIDRPPSKLLRAPKRPRAR